MFFTLTGVAASSAIGVRLRRQTLAGSLLLAPALGLILFTPFAFIILSMIGFSLGKVIGTWVAFMSAAIIWSQARPLWNEHTPDDALPQPIITNRKGITLLAMAMIWGLIPTISVIPFTRDGGLYTNYPLADHVKIAFIDAIVREGMPMKNPFYAPEGKRIALTYSYGFYLPGAIVKRFTGVTGWQAEVAMTWLTSMAIVAFLAAVATALAGSAAAGACAIAAAGVGPLAFDLLPVVFGPRLHTWIGLPPSHGLEVPWLQLAWAPQAAFSALAVVVLLWLVCATLPATRLRVRFIVAIALAGACGFETSSWVGGVALLAVIPLLLIAAASLRLGRLRNLIALKTIAPAVLLAMLCVLPLLKGYTTGTQQANGGGTIGFQIYRSTLVEEYFHLTGNALLIARIILYWIHLLPLSYSVMYLVGLPAMIAWRARTLAERSFRATSIAGTIGFFLVSQFIISTIRNNDLGWRAINVAVMLLSIFTGIGLASLLKLPGDRWRWHLPRYVSIPVSFALLTAGLMSTGRLLAFPIPPAGASIDERTATMHHAFAEQAQAWQFIRHYTNRKDLVQSNPNAFDKLPPYPTALPFHLFADRSTPYSCDATGRTYAFRYSWADNREQGRRVAAVFSAKPKVIWIKYLRWDLNVKAILVTPADGVWSSTAIEKSGVYKLAKKTDDYKIYLAKKSGSH